jgi:phenylacetate-coenzyme A ligase PaaK-like adenylate-forming protein
VVPGQINQHAGPLHRAKDPQRRTRSGWPASAAIPNTVKSTSAATAGSEQAWTAPASAAAWGPWRAARLRRFLTGISQRVPFYRDLWREAGVDVRGIHGPQDLAQLPTIAKSALLARPVEDRVDPRHARGRIVKDSTSGSTGQPFQMWFNPRTLRHRRIRAWYALFQSGYRPGQRVLKICHDAASGAHRPLKLASLTRWAYADLYLDEPAMLSAYAAARPHVLYGPLSSLVGLAQRLQESSQITHRPHLIVSSGEQLTVPYRRLLRDSFGVDVTDFYGITEFGLVLWRLANSITYSADTQHFFIEYLPAEGAGPYERLVVTDLTGGVMPLIRYDTGDLVRRDKGLPGEPIVELAGREMDFLLLPDGSSLSPYQVEVCIEQIPGIAQFRVRQQRDLSIDLELLPDAAHGAEVIAQASEALRTLFCGTLAVRAVRCTEPIATVHGKFRPIHSLARRTAD